MRIDPPDLNYSLDPDVRSRLRLGFDVSALERLMQAIAPGYREEIGRCFVWAVNGEQFELRAFPDPVLNDLLAQVHAPFLRSLDDALLADPEIMEYAGVADEMRRRGLTVDRPLD